MFSEKSDENSSMIGYFSWKIRERMNGFCIKQENVILLFHNHKIITMPLSENTPVWAKNQIWDYASNQEWALSGDAWISRAFTKIWDTPKNAQDNFVIQNALKALWHNPGRLDGMIWPATHRAADEFKKLKWINEVGIGKETIKALKTAIGNEIMKDNDNYSLNPWSEMQRFEKRAPFDPNSLKVEKKVALWNLESNMKLIW